jgi:peptidylprolyl isomerase
MQKDTQPSQTCSGGNTSAQQDRWQHPPKQKWELSAAEKLEQAKQLKAEGTLKFQTKSWALAAAAYEDAVEYAAELANSNDDEGDDDAEAAALVASCCGNAAQCYINLCDWPSAIASAAKVLDKDPNNVKALYRRGLARIKIGVLDLAKKDLLAAFKLEPENKAVKVCARGGGGGRRAGVNGSQVHTFLGVDSWTPSL